ncbi:MAG: hypothetical protein DYG87_10935 [Anaerolineae bacterium CFX3]|jgi:hypothetical protein|nr:hypothetical protein [Anaerolineae bacterium]MBV6466290.1 hypothetical protein [Anaerolineales bacterium]MCE7906291.1 hypothetical protein [Anaerolineae bacterium CFX3]MDL1926241.1 hypothetical protein [Anaerolineae bacterium AMX1]GER78719.1 conserved hypothetical protein [Candidatus Denitrolinea symbiosum]
MLTAYRKKVTVRPDGRIEISDPILKPGTEAEVIVLVETISAEERAARVDEWKQLFKATQSLPQAKTITEEDIAAEIAAYRAGK